MRLWVTSPCLNLANLFKNFAVKLTLACRSASSNYCGSVHHVVVLSSSIDSQAHIERGRLDNRQIHQGDAWVSVSEFFSINLHPNDVPYTHLYLRFLRWVSYCPDVAFVGNLLGYCRPVGIKLNPWWFRYRHKFTADTTLSQLLETMTAEISKLRTWFHLFGFVWSSWWRWLICHFAWYRRQREAAVLSGSCIIPTSTWLAIGGLKALRVPMKIDTQ